MKMKPEHYRELKAAISVAVDKETAAQHRKNLKQDKRVKDLEMRFRWDCFWVVHSRVNTTSWYSYISDTHMDTALKRVVKELGL